MLQSEVSFLAPPSWTLPWQQESLGGEVAPSQAGGAAPEARHPGLTTPGHCCWNAGVEADVVQVKIPILQMRKLRPCAQQISDRDRM